MQQSETSESESDDVSKENATNGPTTGGRGGIGAGPRPFPHFRARGVRGVDDGSDGRRVNKTQTPSFSAQRQPSPLDFLLHHHSHHIISQSPTTPPPHAQHPPGPPPNQQSPTTPNASSSPPLIPLLPHHCSCSAPPVLPPAQKGLTACSLLPSPTLDLGPRHSRHVASRPQKFSLLCQTGTVGRLLHDIIPFQPKGSLLLHTPRI